MDSTYIALSSLLTPQRTFTLHVTLTHSHTFIHWQELPHRVLIRGSLTFTHNHTPLAQPLGAIWGHMGTWTGGAGNRTSDLQIGGRPALPPEPQPPTTQWKVNLNVVVRNRNTMCHLVVMTVVLPYFHSWTIIIFYSGAVQSHVTSSNKIQSDQTNHTSWHVS